MLLLHGNDSSDTHKTPMRFKLFNHLPSGGIYTLATALISLVVYPQ